MGGIGKTFLAKRIAENIKNNFDYLIWRRLRERPSITKILTDLIKHLSEQKEINLPDSLADKITSLMEYLNNYRCLIILDNIESIMDDTHAGQYLKGYEDYRELFNAIGESSYKSCLLLTSREKPQNFDRLTGDTQLVRVKNLEGFTLENGKEFLRNNGISDLEDEKLHQLITLYGGNPLFLKLAANHIEAEFSGSVSQFLEKAKPIIGESLKDSEDERDAIRKMLDWYFNRLTDEHKEIMYWLAINREAVSISKLKEDILSNQAQEKLTTTLQSLQRRIPLEKSENNEYTLQNVLIEYMTEKLVKKVCTEIEDNEKKLLETHALLKAQAPEYVRKSQIRLILNPIAERLSESYDVEIEERLNQLVNSLPRRRRTKASYCAGNILNFFCHIDEINLDLDLMERDFSQLNIRQVDLRGIEIHNINFTDAELYKCFFTQPQGSISSVAFSPKYDANDSKFFAAGDTKNQIILWNLAEQQISYIFRGHENWVQSVDFCPKEEIIVSGSEDKTVKLWDINSHRCIQTIEHPNNVISVLFSPDGLKIASASQDKTIKIWHRGDDQYSYFATLKEAHGRFFSFSPDGSKIASGGDDCTINIWEVDTQKIIQSLVGHKKEVYTVIFSPDGSKIASGSNDGEIKIWKLDNDGCFIEGKTLNKHTRQILSLTFCDCETLVSSSSDRTIKIWNIDTGNCLKTLQGHSTAVWTVASSSQGNLIASGGGDQSVRLWDSRDGQLIKIFQGYMNSIWSVVCSPDGEILASGCEDKKVVLWDAINHQYIKSLSDHENIVWTVTFSPDSKWLISGSGDATVKVWKINNILENKSVKLYQTLREHKLLVNSVAFNADGSIFASASRDHTIILWKFNNQDIEEGEWQYFATLEEHTDSVLLVSFINDILISGSRDKTVKFWNITTGQTVKECSTNRFGVFSISPDGKLLATGGNDRDDQENIFKIWKIEIDSDNSVHIKEPEQWINSEHKQWINCLAFSPNNEFIASGSGDQTVGLWNLKTKSRIHLLGKHNNSVCSVTFYYDKSRSQLILASSSEDATIKLWDVNTGECLNTLKPPGPYKRMNITGIRFKDLNDNDGEEQKKILKRLGAIEE